MFTNQMQVSLVCYNIIGFWQKSGSTTNPDVPSRLLRSSGDSDASLDGNGMQNDDGWLDQNPEAKMHLSDLSIEENISDDELEVRRGMHHTRTHTRTHAHTHTCTHTQHACICCCSLMWRQMMMMKNLIKLSQHLEVIPSVLYHQ